MQMVWKDTQANSLEDTQARSLEDTQADSLEDTQAGSLEDTQAGSLEDTQADSLEDTQANSLEDTQADSLEDTQVDSLKGRREGDRRTAKSDIEVNIPENKLRVHMQHGPTVKCTITRYRYMYSLVWSNSYSLATNTTTDLAMFGYWASLYRLAYKGM